MSQRAHGDVTASGVRLRVLIDGDGPPVVLLHGLFVDSSCWSGVIEHLRPEFRLVAPDLPGFGESEKPAASRFPYDIDSFVGAVADLYAGLQLGRAAVVGHGLGGAIALTLAARYPELVSKLVLVDSLCYPAPLDLRRRIVLLPAVGGFVFKQIWGRSSFRRFFRETLLSPSSSVASDRIDDYYDRFNSPAARGSALSTLRATLDARAVVAQTTRVQAPTLVVWGRADKLYPAGFGQRLAREIRGAGFELLDAGHAVPVERPHELAQLVARFLRDERTSVY